MSHHVIVRGKSNTSELTAIASALAPTTVSTQILSDATAPNTGEVETSVFEVTQRNHNGVSFTTTTSSGAHSDFTVQYEGSADGVNFFVIDQGTFMDVGNIAYVSRTHAPTDGGVMYGTLKQYVPRFLRVLVMNHSVTDITGVNVFVTM